MQILFDHNLPRKLRQHFPLHQVTLTKEMGWQQQSNGELLSLAQAEFDVLLTVDANIYHQQKVALYNIAVIVLRVYDNSYESIVPLLPAVMKVLEEIQPGEIRYVYVNEKLRESDERRGKGPYAENSPQ
jgi:predicted nuclease of predicted toxin-antitoxin system